MKNKLFVLACFMFLLFACLRGQAQTIINIAGSDSMGYGGDGGPATAATLSHVYGIAVDAASNVYFADAEANCIRKIDGAGIITTIAGNGTSGYSGDGGAATAAQLGNPWGITVDRMGNIYIADVYYEVVRKVNTSGTITTIAGAGRGIIYYTGGSVPATDAQLQEPTGVAVDGSGNVYISDYGSEKILKVNASGILTTIAGTGGLCPGSSCGDNGPATAAEFNIPYELATDNSGEIFVSDENDFRVREINTAGIITTVAGNGTLIHFGDGGPATAAQIDPFDAAPDSAGNIYIADKSNQRVRKVNTAGIINTIAGNGFVCVSGVCGDGGPATNAPLNIQCLAVDGAGNIYVSNYSRIRKIVTDNHPPHFASGRSQRMHACENDIADAVNALLAITDTDRFQTEVWSVINSPTNGVLNAAYRSGSNGGVITPTGLYYTPAPGYLGSDSFSVIVSDAIATDTTTVYVMVNPRPGAITGAGHVCTGATIALSDTSAGGVWSSGVTGVATVGTMGIVTGVAVGNAAVTYTSGMGCMAVTTITVNLTPAMIGGAMTVCAGATTTLNDANSGGTWSSSNTAVATAALASGAVSGITAGTAVITYTLGGVCSSVAAFTVNALPDVIMGVMNTCPGSTTLLSEVTTGGTWSSGNTTVVSAVSGGAVSGVAPGTAIVSYTIAGTGCAATATVTVNPLPLIITGISNVCAGSAVMLHDATGGGTWSSGTTAAATVSGGSVTGVSPGTAAITYTLGTGCTRSITVTVNPLPDAVTGAVTVCPGTTTALTDGTSGGVWSSYPASGGIATVAATGTLTGVSPGTASVSYTITGTGCATATVVTVNPLPDAVTGTLPAAGLCIGATATLADGTSGGSWSPASGGTAIVSAGSGVVTGVAAGTATITYTLPTGCIATHTVSVNPYHVPAAIAGTASVCAGATTNLTDGTTGGAWSSGSTTIATIGTAGTVAGVIPGTSAVTYLLGTGCAATKIITVNPAPGVFAVSGGGSYCAGAGGVPVGLGGSAVGISYQLFYGVTLVGSPMTGTGGALAFGLQTLEEVYTIVASNALTGCSVTMSGTAPVITDPLPAIHAVSGGGHYCAGGAGVHVGLDGSGGGINYDLYRGGVAAGSLPGTGGTVDFGLMTAAGVYTVVAVNDSSGCTDTMTGSAAVTIDPLVTPSVSIATGIGDTVCSGSPLTITATAVNGGATPAFAWTVNGSAVAVTGGAYTYLPTDGDVVAVTLASSAACAVPDSVSSSLTLSVLATAAPAVHIAASPGDSVCEGTAARFTAAISYGGTAPALSWVVNSGIVHSGASYSYNPANLDVIYCVLGSNYQCRTADSGTSNIISMTVADSSTPVVTVTASPGVTIAHGQSVTLTAAVTHGGAAPAYQWYLNGAAVSGADGATFTDSSFANGDSVSCEVTGNSICDISGYGWAVFDVSEEGVAQPAAGEREILRVWPNPNEGLFTMNLLSAIDEQVQVTITDITGQKVKEFTATTNIATDIKFNEAGGVYFLSVISAHGLYVAKVTVEK